MKKLISCIILALLIISCGEEKTGNMLVKGQIDGLKKGSLFLQKLKDTVLISVDSIHLNGTTNFTLSDVVESPEVYYLLLDKKTDNKIAFFGEKGEITINTKLDKFSFAAKISGSKNQSLLDTHKEMLQKFNGKQLDLLKEKFEAQRNGDTALYSKIEKEENSLIKRKFYYTTNFAINNGDYEVAPYIALTDLYYANLQLLDTINNSLSKKVKTSKYGIELDKFIEDIKENDEQ